MLPISEKEISSQINREIKSPILVSSLTLEGVDQKAFLEKYAKAFEELPWDPYDARRQRVEFLKKKFPHTKKALDALMKPYFLGKAGLKEFSPWTNIMFGADKEAFHAIQPWRRRSVSQFLLSKGKDITIKREPVAQFVQDLKDDTDYRSWPRVFTESPKEHVETPLFEDLLRAIFKVVQEKINPAVNQVRMTAHFMSVKATAQAPGDNSPEGAHEDGADFIVSALVINRTNVGGGESQVIEKMEDGNKETIFSHTLAPGEFIFQADTGEEKTYGNDLWHHVTPFHVEEEEKGEGWRDIIGFDITVVG